MVSNSYSIIPYVDLTSLADTDTEQSIIKLCQRAKTIGEMPVAAVCVYPKFINTVKAQLLHSPIRVATVSNFPTGRQRDFFTEIDKAIADGVDEIDWVLPYERFIAGDDLQKLCQEVRSACQNKTLKVIIESGAHPNVDSVRRAAELVIASGADFVKTSTGKIAQGADLAAVEAILQAIIASSSDNVGIKVAGGVRRLIQAYAFMGLAVQLLGPSWLSPQHFRLGCSQFPN